MHPNCFCTVGQPAANIYTAHFCLILLEAAIGPRWLLQSGTSTISRCKFTAHAAGCVSPLSPQHTHTALAFCPPRTQVHPYILHLPALFSMLHKSPQTRRRKCKRARPRNIEIRTCLRRSLPHHTSCPVSASHITLYSLTWLLNDIDSLLGLSSQQLSYISNHPFDSTSLLRSSPSSRKSGANPIYCRPFHTLLRTSRVSVTNSTTGTHKAEAFLASLSAFSWQLAGPCPQQFQSHNHCHILRPPSSSDKTTEGFDVG